MKLIFVLILITTSLFASVEKETNSMNDVLNTVQKKVKKYGAKNVLMVFDIDNTLLKMKQNFGSDQWFNWQASIFKNKGCKPACVGTDFGTLLDVQGKLFALSPMYPTEPELAGIVNKIQDMGVKVIALTSRGPEFRSATEKQLKRNGFVFKKPVGSSAGIGGSYYPYNIKKLKKSGLNKYDKETAGLGNARKSSYQNGVYMTAGQNKGIMLKVLLNKYDEEYKAIVFADDHHKHPKRMMAIMGKLTDLTTYRYGKMDKQVEAFKKSNKKTEINQWVQLNKFNSSTFK